MHQGTHQSTLSWRPISSCGLYQFELRTHKRLIDILEPTVQTVDELKKLNLPAGVEITLNV